MGAMGDGEAQPQVPEDAVIDERGFEKESLMRVDTIAHILEEVDEDRAEHQNLWFSPDDLEEGQSPHAKEDAERVARAKEMAKASQGAMRSARFMSGMGLRNQLK